MSRNIWLYQREFKRWKIQPPAHGFRALFPFICFLISRANGGFEIASGPPASLGAGKIPYKAIALYITFRGLQGQQGVLGSIRAILWIPIGQSLFQRLTCAAFEHIMTLSLDFHLFPMGFGLGVAAIYFLIKFDAFYSLILIGVMWSYIYMAIYMAQWRAKARWQMAIKDREMDGQIYHNGALDKEATKFGGHVDTYQRAEYSVLFSLNLLNVAQNTILTLGILLVTFLSSFQISISVQTIAVLISILAYFAQLQAPLYFFQSFYNQVQNNLIDAERLLALMMQMRKISAFDPARSIRTKTTRHSHVSSSGFHDRRQRHHRREEIFSQSSPPIPAGAVVHDNGCGTGAVTRAILEIYSELVSSSPATSINATDINPTFIGDFKKQVASRGWESTVHPTVMAAEDLALPDSTITHSFTNFLIFGSRNAPKAAAESLRTLVPGGVAVMTTWATLPHAKALDLTREKLHGEHNRPHIKPEWFDSSHLKSLLKNAGFSRVEVVQANSAMMHESMDAWTQMAWSWMGMPQGGWTEKGKRDWDKNRQICGEECLRNGFKVDKDGRVRVNMIAKAKLACRGRSCQP
ncbi:S-adenosyl-L-methionine-dependent methyltransferase [Phaeosphaeriaceae sp. PMI808]|nr:S-adenosyl-L-methionine-dependent methyltransferase [Phaeosphaeriaceae sp. PMI808]